MRKLIFLCILSLLSLFSVAAQETAVEEVWQKEIPFGRSPNVYDLVTDEDDTIYVLDQYQGIMVFSPEGELLKTIFRDGLFDNPDEYLMDMAVGENDTYWVASADNHTVYKLDGAGNILLELDDFGDLSPRRVEIGPDDNVYVFETYAGPDDYQRGRIVVFRQDGHPLYEFDTQVDPAELDFGVFVDMAFNETGRLYLSEYGPPGGGPIISKVRVFELTETGAAVETPSFAEENLPSGINYIAVSDEGMLAIVGSASEIPIHLLDSEGNLLAAFGENYLPRGIAFFSNGDVLIVTSQISSIQFVRFSVE